MGKTFKRLSNFFQRFNLLCSSFALFLTYIVINQISASSQQVEEFQTDSLKIKSSEEQQSPSYVMGKRLGLKATDLEIQNRRKVEKVLNPQNFLSDSTLKAMVVSDKYVQNLAKELPNEELLISMFDSLKRHNKELDEIEYEIFKPILSTRIILSNPVNRQVLFEEMEKYRTDQIEKLNKSDTSKNENSDVSSEDPSIPNDWTINELKLVESPPRCLAYDVAASNCVINTTDFNKSLFNFRASAEISLQDARLKNLDRLLNIAYLSEMGKLKGIDKLPEVKRLISLRERNGPKTPILNRVKNDSSLVDLYRKNYKEMFSERYEVFVDLIGSSDSLFIDSIYQNIQEKIKKDSISKGNEKKQLKNVSSTKVTKSLWINSNVKELTPEIVKAVDSLNQGEYSPLIQTPFGFFLIKVSKVKYIKETPFEEAKSRLQLMSLRGKSIRNISEKEINSFYEHHKTSFKKPDTILIAYKLNPDLDSVNSNFSQNKNLKKVFVHQLPADIKKVFKTMPEIMEKDTIDFFSRYGYWFCIIQSINKGKGYQALKDVRHLIREKINSMPKKDIEVPKDEKQIFIQNELIARAYWRSLLNSVPEPDSLELKEIQSDIQLTKDIPPGYPDELRMQHLIMLYKDKVWRVDMEAWKSAIELNTEIF